MALQFYNSLTKRIDIFRPLTPGKVSMYVCGPTVYNRPHIGNARSVVIYDLLYRLLINLYGKENILYIRNITDVDDKIIDAAQKQNIAINILTEKVYQQFTEDMNYVNCLPPTKEPKATEHIAEMIQIIEKLIAKNIAYISNSHVYFDVTKYKDYTQLSGRSLEELESGYRIEVSKDKKNPADFVLWKPADDADKSAKFASPWGYGRPGWHIECSAMSTKYLGKDFDIHGGGADLIFPHHTNEIAQSCCAFENSSYAKYWLHNGFLTVNGEKMSKSLGNFITVYDLVNKQVNGEVIRYYLLSTHYRKPLNWTQKGLNDAKQSIEYFYRILDNYDNLSEQQEMIDEKIIEALKDDLNTPLAFANLHEISKKFYKATTPEEKNLLALRLYNSGKLLGLFYAENNQHKALSPELADLIAKRSLAKKEKNWKLADEIREKLRAKNIILEDTPEGKTNWKYIK